MCAASKFQGDVLVLLILLGSVKQLQISIRLAVGMVKNKTRAEKYGGRGHRLLLVGESPVHRVSGNDDNIALAHFIKGLIDEKGAFAAVYVYDFVPVMLMVGQLALRAFGLLVVQKQRERQFVAEMLADRFHDAASLIKSANS